MWGGWLEEWNFARPSNRAGLLIPCADVSGFRGSNLQTLMAKLRLYLTRCLSLFLFAGGRPTGFVRLLVVMLFVHLGLAEQVLIKKVLCNVRIDKFKENPCVFIRINQPLLEDTSPAAGKL